MMSNTSSIQSTERVGQVAIRGEQQRYVYYRAFMLVIKHGLRATDIVLRRSTPTRSISSMIIHSLTSSISIDLPSLTDGRMRESVPESWEGGNGVTNDGGTNSPMFAEDGETLSLDRRSTWVFTSSVHMARQLHTCWHTHRPFPSSSITLKQIGTSLQKKRE